MLLPFEMNRLGVEPRRYGAGPMIPSVAEDVVAILTAATPDELWRWLVLHPHLRAFPNPTDAVAAWRRLHRGCPDGAVQTAGLLCTDHRWRRVTAPLVAAMEQSGLLTDAEREGLANGFLWSDQYRWPVPEAWIRDRTVTIDVPALPPGTPLHLERLIAPPLRRWAAGVVGRHPSRSHDILDRAGELDARAGDAVFAGLLDAADRYPDDVRDALIDLGCSWPGAPARLRALQLLAVREGAQAAIRRAAGDPNGRIRGWAASLDRQPPLPAPLSEISRPRADQPRRASTEQASLFG